MKLLELISKYQKFIISAVLILAIIAFFDRILAVGLIFISFLVAVTFLAINKNKRENKILGLLFLIAILIHLAAVLFVHYANFQPFSSGTGDYTEYNSQAQEIAKRVHQGNFSLKDLSVGHYYPVIIGYIYAFTMPEMLIGQIFNVWLIALLVIFVYLIVQEIGGSEKQGFLSGLIVSVYPSLLFYGSLLLKDVLVVLLSLIALLLMLKLIQRFSWPKFLIFYIVLGCLIHFRFYIGYALILSFIFCWLLFASLKIKKRIAYGIIIIIVFGFLSQIATTDQGYYGKKFLKQFLNAETITYYREVVYSPLELQPSEPQSSGTQSNPSLFGRESSVTIKTGFENPFTFFKNSLISFTYSLFGPFPWQMKHLRHFFALPEVIGWWFLLFFIIKGAIKSIRRYRVILPLIVFSLIVFAILSLFINNFGIITRIRMPAFISLLCLVPFGINWSSNSKGAKLLERSLAPLLGSQPQ